MSLSMFFAENAAKSEHIKYAASPRFQSADGTPAEWEIRAISGTEDEALRKGCAKLSPVPGKKRQFQRETDYDAYLGKLAAACTVYPDLNDTALQDSYHVMGEEAILKAMMTAGEYADNKAKVQEACGFDTTLQDEVDEAKNS